MPGFAAALDAAAKAPAGAVRQLAGLKFALPVTAPSKIICLGLNYAGPCRRGRQQGAGVPGIFLRGPSSLVAHGAPIIRPGVSSNSISRRNWWR